MLQARWHCHAAVGRDSIYDAMRGAAVKTLLILGANPASDAPADLGLTDALSKVKLALHGGRYKVRHFNFLDYTGDASEGIEAPCDPQVTVHTGDIMIQTPLLYLMNR